APILDHALLGPYRLVVRVQHHDLDAPILLASRRGGVAGDRMILAEAAHLESLGVDAVSQEERFDGGAASKRKLVVVPLGAGRVGMAFDEHLLIGMLLQV